MEQAPAATQESYRTATSSALRSVSHMKRWVFSWRRSPIGEEGATGKITSPQQTLSAPQHGGNSVSSATSLLQSTRMPSPGTAGCCSWTMAVIQGNLYGIWAPSDCNPVGLSSTAEKRAQKLDFQRVRFYRIPE